MYFRIINYVFEIKQNELDDQNVVFLCLPLLEKPLGPLIGI